MDLQPDTKTCSRCAVTKPLDDFAKHPKCKFGRAGQCKSCIVEKTQAYELAHPERRRAYNKAYYAATAEEQKAAARQWARDNRDRANAQSRKWARENPEQLAVIQYRAQSKRRAKLEGAGTFVVTDKEMRRIRGADCSACGTQGPSEVDHIIPISRGGRHSVGNLQPLCRACNARKHAKFLVEWRYRKTA